MTLPEHYQGDVLAFFSGHPEELDLYLAFFKSMDTTFPDASVKVQKSQISFYGRHFFAAASLPVRRKKSWPEHCIVITLGLPDRLDSPRIALAVEPYPNRWTHHILLSDPAQLDAELMGWLAASWDFSQHKR